MADLLKKDSAFGIVTVMNANVFTGPSTVELAAFKIMSPQEIYEYLTAGTVPEAVTTLTTEKTARTPATAGDLATIPDFKCYLDHLQTANLTASGPDITISGGQYKSPLIKFGKSCRCEITDALGQKDALVALGGAEEDANGNISITENFPGPMSIIGDIFLIDQKTGKHVPAKIVMYQFLPDSVPSFAFDMSNAATFALNGDLLATTIKASADTAEYNGTFFSIVSAWETPSKA